MTYNDNLASEAVIRQLMRERQVDRNTAIKIYLKERLQSLTTD
tara:strand:+ start:789 stop:917 length:129 start_codon:yes stop_codon:yes gene_type:complete